MAYPGFREFFVLHYIPHPMCVFLFCVERSRRIGVSCCGLVKQMACTKLRKKYFQAGKVCNGKIAAKINLPFSHSSIWSSFFVLFLNMTLQQHNLSKRDVAMAFCFWSSPQPSETNPTSRFCHSDTSPAGGLIS